MVGSDSISVLWCIESGEAGLFRKDSEGDRVPGPLKSRLASLSEGTRRPHSGMNALELGL